MWPTGALRGLPARIADRHIATAHMRDDTTSRTRRGSRARGGGSGAASRIAFLLWLVQVGCGGINSTNQTAPNQSGSASKPISGCLSFGDDHLAR
jgi:hypothetical protein